MHRPAAAGQPRAGADRRFPAPAPANQDFRSPAWLNRPRKVINVPGDPPLWTCPACGRTFREPQSDRNVPHAFRLTSPAEVDAEFAAFLAEAYRVGAQEELRGVRRRSPDR